MAFWTPECDQQYLGITFLSFMGVNKWEGTVSFSQCF